MISSLFPKRGNRNTKRTEKHNNKTTHGKTYNKSPRRINHKATKSKTNTGTTALERSVEQTTGGFKALLQLANFTLGPDATLNTEIHKNLVRIKAPNSVNASKRKHKNQINHYNKQRRVLMVTPISHPDASYQVSSQLAFGFRRRREKKIFKMATMAAILDFRLERF